MKYLNTKNGMPPGSRANARVEKLRFQASLGNDGTLEMMIYGDIVDAGTISMLEAWGYPTDGLISALSVKQAMDSASTFSKIKLRINSPGGDAFEGMAIHSLLSACGKPVEGFVDGVAASSASVVAMACSPLAMGQTSMMMIHNAWSACVGNKGDMTKTASTLDKVDESIAASYAARTGKPLDKMMALMDAETWMTAQDCVDQGFASGITEQAPDEQASAMAMANSFKAFAWMKNLPAPKAAVKNEDLDGSDKCACDCEACSMNGDCANCTNRDCDDKNCEDCPMQSGADNSTTTKPAASASKEPPVEDRGLFEFKQAQLRMRDRDRKRRVA